MRKDFYAHKEWKDFRSDPDAEPYVLGETFVYHPEWTDSSFEKWPSLSASCVRTMHGELVDAWRAIIAAPEPARLQALAALQDVSFVSYERAGTAVKQAPLPATRSTRSASRMLWSPASGSNTPRPRRSPSPETADKGLQSQAHALLRWFETMDTLDLAAVCPACGCRDGFRVFPAREMQFGTRESFTYRECPRCGTLHIAHVPEDLSRFYPSDYYSFDAAPKRKVSFLWARKLWARFADRLARSAGQGDCAFLQYRRHAFYQWARLAKVGFDSEILDIGCGSGGLLRRMQSFGFSALTGVDPYAPGEVSEPGFRVLKSSSLPENTRYDLIMMHHVLEHVADPLKSLEAARASLSRGRLLIRIPVAGSEMHRRYGANWYHLDPPRHLVVPSLKGLELLAQRAHLQIIHRGFDGEEPSILMSESYKSDIPSRQAPRPPRRIRVKHRKAAHTINASGEGDLGVFLLIER